MYEGNKFLLWKYASQLRPASRLLPYNNATPLYPCSNMWNIRRLVSQFDALYMGVCGSNYIMHSWSNRPTLLACNDTFPHVDWHLVVQLAQQPSAPLWQYKPHMSPTFQFCHFMSVTELFSHHITHIHTMLATNFALYSAIRTHNALSHIHMLRTSS